MRWGRRVCGRVLRKGGRPARASLLGCLAVAAAIFAVTPKAQAQCAVNACVVTDSGDGAGTSINPTLRFAIGFANGTPNTVITFSNTIANSTITLAGELPPVLGNGTVIDGGSRNITINGANTYRPFFVGGAGVTGPATTTATIENLTITNSKALGGAGGDAENHSGGGGAGLGGAIFVSSTASLTVSNLSLTSNTAAGGTGGTRVGVNGGVGGGGGMGGNGGAALTSTVAGGGGGFGVGADGGGENANGAPGTLTGANSGGHSSGPATGGANAGGGGGGGNGGGGGGAGGTTGATFTGGVGGFGGGGGGGEAQGGNGGYGGGGGAGNILAGSGGFGGGGGGGGGSTCVPGGNAPGGFGGGAGNADCDGLGGGGAGLGGAIFVQMGGSINVTGTLSVDGTNQAIAGPGGFYNVNTQGLSGQGFGSAIFFQGTRGSASSLSFGAGSQSIGGVIADYIGSGGTNPNGGTNAANQGGSLALVKSGSGTLTLSGTNTYTGATTINGSTTLALSGAGSIATSSGVATNGIFDISQTTTGASIVTLSGSGTVDLGSKTLTISNGSTTFSGVIADAGIGGGTAGKLAVTGGTQTLSGTNTYTGGATVSGGGFINFSSAANFGSAPITLNGGGLQWATGTTTDISSRLAAIGASGGSFDTNSNNVSFGSALSGNGKVTKLGAGTLTYTVANAYSGGTTVSGGFINFSSAANFGSGLITLNGGGLQWATGTTTDISSRLAAIGSNGTSFDTNSNNVSFGSALSGAGVTKLGGGTLTYTVANAYSGGTTVSGGFINFSSAANFGSGLITLNGGGLQWATGTTTDISSRLAAIGASGGSFDTNGSNVSFGSALSGAGVTKIGAGKLTFTVANTYTGGTTINAGTLSIASGGSIVSTTTVNNGGTFNVNGIAAGVTVNAGGTLSGNGTVGNTTFNGGTLGPGNSIGTLNVSGNLVLSTATTYMVEVSPTAADGTSVTGTATLAGTVQATFATGAYLTRSYTIVSAGSRGGTFGTLSTQNLPAGFTATLSYTATDAILNLTANLGVPTPTGPSALGNSGLNGNQLAAATALNTFFNNGGTLPPAFVTVFGITGDALKSTLTQLSAEGATGGAQASFVQLAQFLGLLLDPFVEGRDGGDGFGASMGYAPEKKPSKVERDADKAFATYLKAPPMQRELEQKWGVWASAFGGSNRTGGDPIAGSNDFSARVSGYAGGIDYKALRNTVIGVAVAGGNTNWNIASGLGGGRAEVAQVAGYASTRWNNFYLSGALAGAWYRTTTHRTVTITGIDRLTADFDATNIAARGEAGYRFALANWGLQNWGLTPYAAIQTQNYRTPNYAERALTGSNQFALTYAGATTNDTRSELGAWADTRTTFETGTLILRGRAAWMHDYNPNRALTPTFQTLPGASFVVNGAAAPHDAALTSAAAELRLRNNVSLIGKFDGEFANRSTTYAGTGTVRYAW